MQVNGSRSIMACCIKCRMFVLIATIAFSDFLVFDRAPGLNLFVLSVSLAAAVLLGARKRMRLLPILAYLGISALAAAPLIEAPTWCGFFVSMFSVVSIALAGAGFLPRRPNAIAANVLRFLPLIPIRLPRDGGRYFGSHSGRSIFGKTQIWIAGWTVPLGLGLVFLLLFSAANPLIEIGLRRIDFALLRQVLDIRRIGFWLISASFVWALMRPRLIPRATPRRAKVFKSGDRIGTLLDHATLVRSLCVFNLLFALETMLDLTYLWGGADLPSGMSHAEYAHRGAYSLVATALLAALFVLVAMRRGGPGGRSPLIRGLVFAWIMQNVLLCLSSLLRLDLYIEAYSLTGWRVAAGIWMVLVAAGLMFILLRITLRRSNEWLISINLVSLLAVLYLAALFDFSGYIARFNVENSIELGRPGIPVDIDYLASLGPSAIPALDLYLASVRNDVGKQQQARYVRNWLAKDVRRRSGDWRSWSYRAARTGEYLRSTALTDNE